MSNLCKGPPTQQETLPQLLSGMVVLTMSCLELFVEEPRLLPVGIGTQSSGELEQLCLELLTSTLELEYLPHQKLDTTIFVPIPGK